MISAQAVEALDRLEHGARFNTLHTVARELIDAGLAQEDWGALALTEAGRIYLRRGAAVHIPINCDDHISDLSVHQMRIPKGPIDRRPVSFWKNRATDPMASPQHVLRDEADEDVGSTKPLKLIEEAPVQPLPVAETRKQEMLRAAGVASGKTGVWVEEAWVLAFVEALDH